MIGLRAAESKGLTHRYPRDHTDAELQGKTVEFQASVRMVRGSRLPELDDEFAKAAGPFENLQALRETLKANITSQSKAEYDDQFFTQVLDEIKAGAKISYAPQTLERELKHVMDDIRSRLAQQGLDLPAYLKSRNMDEPQFVEQEARPMAVRRLERGLLIDELARAEKIEIGRDTLNASFQQTWGEIAGSQGFQKQMRGKAQPPKQLMNAVAVESANRAYVQLTLERLKAIASGEVGKAASESEGKSAGRKRPSASEGGSASKTSPKGRKPARGSAEKAPRK
jgi:trigger factor